MTRKFFVVPKHLYRPAQLYFGQDIDIIVSKPIKETTMKKRNEVTSKAAAKAASAVLRNSAKRKAACRMIISAMQAQIEFIEEAEKAAASALTQTPDRK